MSYVEFDGVACFTVRAWTGIPAARFTLRFHEETSGTSCYLTKSLCSHRENYRARLNGERSKIPRIRRKKEIPGEKSLSARSRYRNLRIKIHWQIRNADFLPTLGYPRIDAIGQLSGSPGRKSR